MRTIYNAATGERTVDPVWVNPANGPLYLSYAEASATMTEWINALTGKIQNLYPVVVQKNWEDEEAMAAAFMAGTANAQQLATVTADGAAKGRTPSEHATRILENAHQFRGIAEQTRRLWLATDKALADVTDPADYEIVLAAAQAQAAPLAEAYGLG